MFDRFTEQARGVIVYAQEEARGLNHAYIGTEHLLLGLLRDVDGVAAHVLRSQGLDLERVRADVVRIVRVGEAVPHGQIPFTPHAKKVLELAVRAAARNVGTEHLLLGLTREGEGVAAQVLFDFGIDMKAIRAEVLRTAPDAESSGRPAPVRFVLPVDPAWLGGLAPELDRVAEDIRDQLGREPDAGDLLLALGCMDGALTGRALSALGVDPAALAAMIEQLRAEAARTGEDRRRALEEVTRAKEQAIDAGEHERAAELRDRERGLRAEVESQRGLPASQVLEAFRRHLGVAGPGGG